MCICCLEFVLLLLVAVQAINDDDGDDPDDRQSIALTSELAEYWKIRKKII